MNDKKRLGRWCHLRAIRTDDEPKGLEFVDVSWLDRKGNEASSA